MPVRIQFAKRLKYLREKAGLSVKDFAAKSGISPQHVRQLEYHLTQKRVTITSMDKIAKALGIPLWRLVKFEENKSR